MPKQNEIILVLHGPNLNLLGTRQREIYGSVPLQILNQRLVKLAAQFGHKLISKQSNSEHALIEEIHQAPKKGVRFILFNPAAFTHTSVALRDALLAVSLPFIEVHLSNLYAREPFRSHSYFSDIALGVIVGFGSKGYELALHAAIDYLAIEKTP
ncbi:MAG: type II 3-dehydroquinate dehydratase [Gammaproteobacteria bacterium]|nr:type II 3-dehydroquinate dehydratase [Gammaproteobacteria bacterium]